MKPKRGERLCGNCRVSKQVFRTSKKLTHYPLNEMESMGRVNGRRRLISHSWSECYVNLELWKNYNLIMIVKDSFVSWWSREDSWRLFQQHTSIEAVPTIRRSKGKTCFQPFVLSIIFCHILILVFICLAIINIPWYVKQPKMEATSGP